MRAAKSGTLQGGESEMLSLLGAVIDYWFRLALNHNQTVLR